MHAEAVSLEHLPSSVRARWFDASGVLMLAVRLPASIVVLSFISMVGSMMVLTVKWCVLVTTWSRDRMVRSRRGSLAFSRKLLRRSFNDLLRGMNHGPNDAAADKNGLIKEG
jgi:hypothetical protein